MVASLPSEVVHEALPVTSVLVPSSQVAMARNCCVSPTRTEAVAGVM